MKRFFLPACLAGFVWLAACDQEEAGLQVQPHDENAYMGFMHQMMEQMDTMSTTGDPDYDFAMMMPMHHQTAIDMAQYELQNGDDTTIQAIAQRVIAEQQIEISEFTAFLTSYQPDGQTNAAYAMAVMQAMEKMGKAVDLRVLTGDADQDFAALMIDHHQSAIDVSQALLDHGEATVTRELAQNIVASQAKEIDELQTWLLQNKSY
ncbi:Uncharacterized conserved protein, DUF305 family [Catalinimonas alkaloidigena]|uniref:Uncharacterized conserved protein, DUF305 family n=1 Tax=Catalinimonas alkaloidigena TaxID=1075417 RepID=A0A1G9U5N4_9BACT|nr:DUF305 domain-containing protein [Catalinimonas alkaloidigena]SDM55123.1 Uncharacterized conserved protein, DUF305 family [Catalinimonas alkaloidigena]